MGVFLPDCFLWEITGSRRVCPVTAMTLFLLLLAAGATTAQPGPCRETGSALPFCYELDIGLKFYNQWRSAWRGRPQVHAPLAGETVLPPLPVAGDAEH